MRRKTIAWVTGAAGLTIAIAAGSVAFAAATMQGHTLTCPNCGAEVEIPKPEREERMAPQTPEELAASLSEKVANGELTQEEADQMLAEYEERQAEMEARKAEMEQKLQEQVESGELTQEEADEILAGKGPGMSGGPMGGKHPGPGRPMDNAEAPTDSAEAATDSAEAPTNSADISTEAPAE